MVDMITVERAKIRKALDDLAKIKSQLSVPERERLEEIEQTLRSALREKSRSL